MATQAQGAAQTGMAGAFADACAAGVPECRVSGGKKSSSSSGSSLGGGAVHG